MKFALYGYDSCPYCRRVAQVIPSLNVKVEIRNVMNEPKYRQELQAATGRTQVPCLKITDEQGKETWMHESADIIRFLQNQ